MSRNNFLPRLCGFIVSFILSIIVFCTTWNLGLHYVGRIQIVSACIVLLWGFLLIRSKAFNDYSRAEIVLSIVFFIGIGLYLSYAWHEGYISNTPLIGINAASEGMHRDTIYHNALASSIQYYGYPSLLVNSGAFHNYHFGSHMILGFIAKIMNVPTLFVYSYLYPMIFFPLLPSLILSSASGIKSLLSYSRKITIPDILVLMTFLTHFIFPKEWYENIADWKSSWLISESFCVAIVLSLIYLEIWIHLTSLKRFESKLLRRLYALCITPIFIIAISLSKISVGLAFTSIIAYLLFRKKGFVLRYLFLEVFYIGLVFLVHSIPSRIYSPFPSATGEEIFNISPLNFIRTYMESPRFWGMHVLVFYFLAIVFFVYRLRNIQSFKELIHGIANKAFIVEEMLFLVCLVGSLPGMLIAIGGGSAFYFSAIEQIVAAILLIGYDIPTQLLSSIHIKKSWICKVASVFILFCLGFNFIASCGIYAIWFMRDCSRNDEHYAESIKENSYWSTISKINQITEGNKEDYYIYVCSSANIWTKFSDPDCALFFYPAMTGIVCIGELYFEDGQLYTNDNVAKNGPYYYIPLVEDVKLSEADAYAKAQEDGKKAIIYIYDDTMTVVNIK